MGKRKCQRDHGTYVQADDIIDVALTSLNSVDLAAKL